MDKTDKPTNGNYSHLLEGRWKRTALYNGIGDFLVGPVLNRWLDIRRVGDKRVPKESCIFVTNHALYFDALVIGSSFGEIGKKVHGWIEEKVYKSREWLYEPLELIPVRVGKGSTREEQRELMNAFNRSKELSVFWLRNTNDGVALTSDGLAESCIDEKNTGRVKPLPERGNHAGPASLSYDAGALVVPVTAWIPEQHRRALLMADGWKSFRYLENNRKIPYIFYFSEPIDPKNYSKKAELQAEIRKRQNEGWSLLEKFA